MYRCSQFMASVNGLVKWKAIKTWKVITIVVPNISPSSSTSICLYVYKHVPECRTTTFYLSQLTYEAHNCVIKWGIIITFINLAYIQMVMSQMLVAFWWVKHFCHSSILLVLPFQVATCSDYFVNKIPKVLHHIFRF